MAAAATSGVQWLLMGGSVYMGILSVGLTVPISARTIVVAFTVAGLTLPSSPGFFGTIQLGFALAAPFGVLSADAVAASVVWHVLAYLSVSVGGIFFLLRLGYSAGELRDGFGDHTRGMDNMRSNCEEGCATDSAAANSFWSKA